MSKIKNYVFCVELPLMQDQFYFSAEQAEMKKPTIPERLWNEYDILFVSQKMGAQSVKRYDNYTAKAILETLHKYDSYEDYDGEDEAFFYHYHNMVEISLVVSGEGYYFAEGKAIKVSQGSMIMFNALVPHAWVATGDEPTILKTFTMYPTLLFEEALGSKGDKWLKAYFDQVKYIETHNNTLCINCFGQIYNEYEQKETGYQQVIKHLLMAFLMYLSRETIHLEERQTKRHDPLDIEIAIQYIKNNFHQNPTLEDVANQVYMHPNYFSSLFKKRCGISLVDYMNHLKAAMAIELMESTELKMESISEQCGFTSTSNFYRVFKSIYHASPVKYSKQLQRVGKDS